MVGLPGKPDIVFPRQRAAIFCDGDFWHGRNLEMRLARLVRGHNAPYWVDKIRTNVARDRLNTARLEEAGWRVLRLWETDILRDPAATVTLVAAVLGRSFDQHSGETSSHRKEQTVGEG
jgi:DNA mismatch endonuclease (patch repair protein)